MAGSKYTLALEAILGKDSEGILAKNVKRLVSKLESSGVTNIDIKPTFKDGELKKVQLAYENLAKNKVRDDLSMKNSADALGRSMEKLARTQTENFDSVRKASPYYSTLKSQLSKNADFVALNGEKFKMYSEEADKAAKSTNFFESSMMNTIKTAARYALTIGLINKALGELGEGVQYIRELDKALTDTQIVTGFTDKEIQGLAVSYNELAQEMGQTTLDMVDGSLQFFRMGKTIEETNSLVRSSSVMAKLGNLENAESTKYLTSIMNAYKMEASELPGVIDKIIQLDNVFAIETRDVAEGLQRSAVSGQLAKVSLEELSSMIATIGQVTQREGEIIGTSLNFSWGC